MPENGKWAGGSLNKTEVYVFDHIENFQKKKQEFVLKFVAELKHLLRIIPFGNKNKHNTNKRRVYAKYSYKSPAKKFGE